MSYSAEQLAEIRFKLGIECDPRFTFLKNVTRVCEPIESAVAEATTLVPALLFSNNCELHPVDHLDSFANSVPVFSAGEIVDKLCERGLARYAAQCAIYRLIERGFLSGHSVRPKSMNPRTMIDPRALIERCGQRPDPLWKNNSKSGIASVKPVLSLGDDELYAVTPTALFREAWLLSLGANPMTVNLSPAVVHGLNCGKNIDSSRTQPQAGEARAELPTQSAPITCSGIPQPSNPIKDKKSTTKGQARTLILAGLALHHNYSGQPPNMAPIGVRKLVKLILESNCIDSTVSLGSASEFFKVHFGGHAAYQAVCRQGTIISKLRSLLQEHPSWNQLRGEATHCSNDMLDSEDV